MELNPSSAMEGVIEQFIAAGDRINNKMIARAKEMEIGGEQAAECFIKLDASRIWSVTKLAFHICAQNGVLDLAVATKLWRELYGPRWEDAKLWASYYEMHLASLPVTLDVWNDFNNWLIHCQGGAGSNLNYQGLDASVFHRFQCYAAQMRGSRKSVSKQLSEYSLPAGVQSHEMVVPQGLNILLVTQQDTCSLVKVCLDSTGKPVSVLKQVYGDGYGGAHGLFASRMFPGKVWVTLQFNHSLLLLDTCKDPFELIEELGLPSGARGPHSIIEDSEGLLWVTCKDSHHIVRIHLQENRPPLLNTYYCDGRPICVAKTKCHVYATLDMESRIFVLDINTNKYTHLSIPTEYGSTPVGIVASPDEQSAYFVLLGGNGTFGRICGEEITWFKLGTSFGRVARLIHLAFDPQCDLRLWVLSSSLASAPVVGGHSHHPATATGFVPDAVFVVHMEKCVDTGNCSPALPSVRISRQQHIMLPTQGCAAHRVYPHGDGLFVTGLRVSSLIHVTGDVLRSAEGDEAIDSYAFWGNGGRSDGNEFITGGHMAVM